MDLNKLSERKDNIARSTLSNFLCYKLQISTINIKAMIGFSDVQELVSFFKIFAFRKGHLRETKKRCSRSNTILR